MSKITIEEIHDYLGVYKDIEIVDDYVIAHDSGYTEICIYLAKGFGCLNESNPIEKAIIEYKIGLSKFQKLAKECFKGVVIMTNPDNNETWWIPSIENQGVDYFISEDECISWGYTEKHIFE